MKLKPIVLAFASLMLACGLDQNSYKFESGTYGVSGATLASSTDQCGFLGAYTNSSKVIGVASSGTTVTFNLANDPTLTSDQKPTATLDSNVLTTLAEANYTVDYKDNSGVTYCVVRVHTGVGGDVTADNTAALKVSINATTESGTCSGNNTDFPAVPCNSMYDFTAKMK